MGKYRLERVIGAGAMGTVVAAHRLHLDDTVAIKFLKPEALGHADGLARFLQEARASVRISSDHVVRVFDVDVDPESKIPYIVMELLDGCDLAHRLEAEGPPTIGEAVDFVLQACEAISEAHRLGIIHRDLKPANLFQIHRNGRDGFIKVLDFGISKLNELTTTVVGEADGESDRRITGDQILMGSPVYMSPEQMESARDVDERTDVWALGVTLFELITGKLPFGGHSLVHVYFNIASDKPLRLQDCSPDLPVGLEKAIVKCLQRDRDRRFRTIDEFARAIAPFGTGVSRSYLRRATPAAPERSVAEPRPNTASVRNVGGQTLPSASHADVATGRSRHLAWWSTGVLLVVPAIGLLFGAVHQRNAPSPRSAPSTPGTSTSASTMARLVVVPAELPTPDTLLTATIEPRTTQATAEPRVNRVVTPPAASTAVRAQRLIVVDIPSLAPKVEATSAPPAPTTSVPAPTPASTNAAPASVLDRMLQRQD